MSEPTYKQHKILVSIQGTMGAFLKDNHENIDMYWELVRSGFLKNLIVMSGEFNWRFILTDKAEEYLAE